MRLWCRAGALEAWQPACDALGSAKTGSLLRPRKCSNDSLVFVTARLTVLLSGLRQSSLSEEHKAQAGELVIQLWQAIVDKFEEGRASADPSWKLRRSVAKCTLKMFQDCQCLIFCICHCMQFPYC